VIIQWRMPTHDLHRPPKYSTSINRYQSELNLVDFGLFHFKPLISLTLSSPRARAGTADDDRIGTLMDRD
jgi:hypothetical protein